MRGLRGGATNAEDWIRESAVDPAETGIKAELTLTHDDTVTETFGMQHHSLRRNAKVTHHLRCLCIHQRNMLSLNTAFIELLMYKPAEFSPFVTMLHHQKVVATGHEVMRDVRWWPVAIDGALLVDQFLYETPICNDDRIGWPQLEGEDTAI